MDFINLKYSSTHINNVEAFGASKESPSYDRKV